MKFGEKRSAFLILGLLLYAFLSSAVAQTLKNCPIVEVNSISETAKITNPPVNAAAVKVDISKLEDSASDQDHGKRKLLALGPMYNAADSMDDVKVKVICTKKGVSLKTTVVRSAEFTGDILRNTLWRPEVTMLFSPLKANAEIQVIWEMQLSNGKSLSRAKTGHYPEERYPIVVTKTVR